MNYSVPAHGRNTARVLLLLLTALSLSCMTSTALAVQSDKPSAEEKQSRECVDGYDSDGTPCEEIEVTEKRNPAEEPRNDWDPSIMTTPIELDHPRGGKTTEEPKYDSDDQPKREDVETENQYGHHGSEKDICEEAYRIKDQIDRLATRINSLKSQHAQKLEEINSIQQQIDSLRATGSTTSPSTPETKTWELNRLNNRLSQARAEASQLQAEINDQVEAIKILYELFKDAYEPCKDTYIAAIFLAKVYKAIWE